MFKIGDRVKCINNKGWEDKLKTDVIYTVINVDITDEIRIRDFYKTYSYWIRGSRFEKVEDNMEKSFKEAIADIDNIKENEFYICKGDKNLKITKNGIDLEGLDWTNSKFIGFGSKFILQRKQYTFTEAFKAYEEGKEIESCVSGWFFKKVDGVDMAREFTVYPYQNFEKINIRISEIRGKWFINN